MAAAGLRGRRPPRWVRTTTPDPTPPAIPDRVHGQFTAAAPDVLRVGDITYVRTWEGWLYLATVLDVFSRRVIGWAIADHLQRLAGAPGAPTGLGPPGRPAENLPDRGRPEDHEAPRCCARSRAGAKRTDAIEGS